MQIIRKTAVNSLIAILGTLVFLAISIQIPFIQKFIVLKTANHFSQEFGAIQLTGYSTQNATVPGLEG
jgi:hypothetical protein